MSEYDDRFSPCSSSSLPATRVSTNRMTISTTERRNLGSGPGGTGFRRRGPPGGAGRPPRVDDVRTPDVRPDWVRPAWLRPARGGADAGMRPACRADGFARCCRAGVDFDRGENIRSAVGLSAAPAAWRDGPLVNRLSCRGWGWAWPLATASRP